MQFDSEEIRDELILVPIEMGFMSREFDAGMHFLFVTRVSLIEEDPIFVKSSLIVDVLPGVPVSSIEFINCVGSNMEITRSFKYVHRSVSRFISISCSRLIKYRDSIEKMPRWVTTIFSPTSPTRNGIFFFALCHIRLDDYFFGIIASINFNFFFKEFDRFTLLIILEFIRNFQFSKS